MANQRIDMLNIRQLIHLKLQGFSNREIAKRTGIHRNTVNSYLSLLRGFQQDLSRLLEKTDAELQTYFPVHQSSKSEHYQELLTLLPKMEKSLKHPGCTFQSLWYEYKQTHPQGYGYTQFKAYLQQWLNQQQVCMHFEHKMGDKLFIDFAGKKLEIIDADTGEVKPVEVFVAVLGGSQYTYVLALPSQEQQQVVRAINSTLNYLKGVPKAIVPDNMKAVVQKASSYEAIISKQFRQLALHYGTTILAARPRKPQDKSLVERTIKLVYQRIYYKIRDRQFFSLEQLNAVLQEELVVFNQACFQRRKDSRYSLFIEQEQPTLAALPAHPYEFKLYKKAKVQKNSHVYAEGCYYSVPYTYIGKHVEVQFSASAVEFYHTHERLATHPRLFKVGKYHSIAQHLPSQHNYVRGWSLEYFATWAEKRGTILSEYVKRMFARSVYPEHVYKSCMGLQALERQYSLQRLTQACQRAMHYERYGYVVVKNILEQGLEEDVPVDGQTELFAQQPTAQQHPNIRGKHYYQ